MPYPFKNPVNPTYQDVMGSNIGVPSEDLMDFDKTDKAVNASSRLSEIDAEIARLKQRIAEKRAVENAYNRPASVYDYIIGGDRSGLDRISQQKMTEEQAKLQRDLTEKLSKDQKSEQEQYKINEIANKYELANTDYELALQTFNPDDPASIANLKRKAQMLNHYGSQLGFEPVSTDPPASRPKTGVEEQNDYIGVAKELLKKKEYTDADRKKAKELKDKVKDETIKQQLETIIANKGPTKEDLDRELEEEINYWKENGDIRNKTKFKLIIKGNKAVGVKRK